MKLVNKIDELLPRIQQACERYNEVIFELRFNCKDIKCILIREAEFLNNFYYICIIIYL